MAIKTASILNKIHLSESGDDNDGDKNSYMSSFTELSRSLKI